MDSANIDKFPLYVSQNITVVLEKYRLCLYKEIYRIQFLQD